MVPVLDDAWTSTTRWKPLVVGLGGAPTPPTTTSAARRPWACRGPCVTSEISAASRCHSGTIWPKHWFVIEGVRVTASFRGWEAMQLAYNVYWARRCTDTSRNPSDRNSRVALDAPLSTFGGNGACSTNCAVAGSWKARESNAHAADGPRHVRRD